MSNKGLDILQIHAQNPVEKEVVASLKNDSSPVWLEHIICEIECVRGKSECEGPYKPC